VIPRDGRQWLRDGDLSSEPDTAFARRLLVAWRPPDAEQAATRDRIVAWIDAHPDDAHRRTLLAGHLTASALVIDAGAERALLTHHKKLDRWLQLGGHCDGDANLVRVALREAIEESGIADLVIDPDPIDVDVHTIPARGSEPEHWHLDVRFVVRAPAHARAVVSAESHALRWVGSDDLCDLATDVSVRRLFKRVFGDGH
jgi:8-oxo-dGTP pyrophosphatase MutT (NUDIX family)